MPIINREQMFYSFLKERPFIRVISVDSHGVFTIKLPAEVVPMLGKQEVMGRTRDDVLTAFKAAMDQARLTQTTKRKIIVYHIEMAAAIMRGGKCALKRDDLHFSEGIGLVFSASVMEESQLRKPNNSSSYHYEVIESSIPQDAPARTFVPNDGARWDDQIPWTQEAENWFAKVVSAMEELCLMVDGGFKSKEGLQSLITSGKFLSLPKPKE